jgi:hypothetical protein
MVQGRAESIVTSLVGRLSKAVLKPRTPDAATLVTPPNLAKRQECGGSPPLSNPRPCAEGENHLSIADS